MKAKGLLWKSPQLCLRIQKRSYKKDSAILSPLGQSFNSTKLSNFKLFNPLAKNVGLFGIPELTNPMGFIALAEKCMKKFDTLSAEIESWPKNRRSLLEVFDEIDRELAEIMKIKMFVDKMHPNPMWALVSAKSFLKFEAEEFEIRLFSLGPKLREFAEGENVSVLEKYAAKLSALSNIRTDMEISPEELGKFSRDLMILNVEFSKRAAEPTVIDRQLLPEEISEDFPSHSQQDEKFAVTLHHPENETRFEDIREYSFRYFYNHSEEQEESLRKILAKRHQLANLFGYQSFAHMTLNDQSFVRSPEYVENFLDRLWKGMEKTVSEDYSAMSKRKAQVPEFSTSRELNMWDEQYFMNYDKDMVRSITMIREYFSWGVCMEGLSDLFKDLFGVEMVYEPFAKGEVWHTGVKKVVVREVSTGSDLGAIYFDFDNPKRVTMQSYNGIRNHCRRNDGSVQNPFGLISMGPESRATWKTPRLLTLEEFSVLGHEMGHAIHHMLSRTEFHLTSETTKYKDFAELMSSLMEFYLSDPRVLQRMSKHYKTGEQLDIQAFERYAATKQRFETIEIKKQILESEADQIFHLGPLRDGVSTTKVLQDLWEKYHKDSNAPKYVENIALQHRWMWLTEGYGAERYSYLACNALATLIWQKYFQADPFSSEAGMKLRNEVLQHGNSRPCHTMLSDYLGKELTAEELADAIVSRVSVDYAMNRIWWKRS